MPIHLRKPKGTVHGVSLNTRVYTPDRRLVAVTDLRQGDHICGPSGDVGTVLSITGTHGRAITLRCDSTEITAGDATLVGVEALHRSKGSRQWNFATVQVIQRTRLLPVAPLRFDGDVSCIDPYTLGLLLGDGGLTRKASPRFTTKDPQLLGHLQQHSSGATWVGPYGRYDYQARSAKALRSALVAMGLWGCNSHNKFIPDGYLGADVDTRLALLQGLLDTDGTVDPHGRVSYCTVSPKLARDVEELIYSLGGHVGVGLRQNIFYTSPTQTTKKRASNAFMLRNIGFKNGLQSTLFKLQRKQGRVKLNRRYNKYGITCVAENDNVELLGIRVDTDSGMYVTEGLFSVG